jgi:hypothetical protein
MADEMGLGKTVRGFGASLIQVMLTMLSCNVSP